MRREEDCHRCEPLPSPKPHQEPNPFVTINHVVELTEGLHSVLTRTRSVNLVKSLAARSPTGLPHYRQCASATALWLLAVQLPFSRAHVESGNQPLRRG